jgi:hypothetical protein
LIPFCLAFVWISRLKSIRELRPKLLIKLCLLNVIWVNLHGSFILLELMLAWKLCFLWLADFEAKEPGEPIFGTMARPVVSLFLVAATALFNPFSYRIYPYIVQTLLTSHNRAIEEWQKTTVFAHPPIGLMFYVCVVLACAAVVWHWKANRRSLSGKEKFWRWISSPFFLIVLDGFTGIRNAALVFVVLLPALRSLGYLDRSIATLRSGWQDWNKPKRTNFIKAALFVLLFVMTLPFFRQNVLNVEPIASLTPQEWKAPFAPDVVSMIVEKIRSAQKPCPIFENWTVGSYLMLTLPNKIFIDSRNTIYDDEQMALYDSAEQGKPGWDDFLNRYGACFAVLKGSQSQGLIVALENSPDWNRVLSENGYVLFQKTRPH